MNRQAVVVTTEYRGVFFGYATDDELEKARNTRTVRLADARNCIYWSRDVGGFLGLANTGPKPGSRIGAKCPALMLQNVTAVLECTSDAADAWEKAPCVS